MKYTYFYIDLFTILVPLLASFHPRLQFYRQWSAFWPANLLSGLLFLVWDAWFTRAGVWGFNEKYVYGWYVYNLPVEEVLFFICIPYACIFSYYCLQLLWLKETAYRHFSNILSGCLVLLLAITIVRYHEKAYPAVTALLLLAFVVYNNFLKKQPWMGALYITYGIMLMPFLIVNGLLTGSWIAEPVVWYNTGEILNIRILTIPIEDIFYGLLMVGINTMTYEFVEKRQPRLQWKHPGAS